MKLYFGALSSRKKMLTDHSCVVKRGAFWPFKMGLALIKFKLDLPQIQNLPWGGGDQ